MTEKSLQDLAEEFAHRPYGPHSRELLDLLNLLRGAPMSGKYCLIEIKRHQLWQLARQTGVRGEAPIAMDGITFGSLFEAEVEVFKRRVREMQSINEGARL